MPEAIPQKERIVISLGGSLIVPQNGIDTAFLTEFRGFILSQLEQYPNRQFFLVTGGGSVCRQYNAAAEAIVAPGDEDLDWMGIQVSRVNAQLVRTIFGTLAHPEIIIDFSRPHDIHQPVVVAGGWKPGRSTDFVAVKLAEDFGANCVINLSNIVQVYDKDPKKFNDAKPLERLDWQNYLAMVGEKWSPGLSTPFDPTSAKRAAELGLEVIVMNGKDLKNLEHYLEGQKFTGSVLAPQERR